MTGEFSTAAFELSDSGTGKELSQYLLALSEIEKKARDWQHDQAEDDMTTFMGTGRIVNAYQVTIHLMFLWIS